MQSRREATTVDSGKGLGGVGDPIIGSKEHDEALDHDPLGPKTMK